MKIRKKTIGREIEEQKRLGNLGENATYSEVLANSEVRDYMGNNSDDNNTFNKMTEFVGSETGLTANDMLDVRTNASEGSLDIYGALKGRQAAVDYDSREQTLSQWADEGLGLQEQYNVKIGFLDAEGNPTTAEGLADDLNMNLEDVITFVQANPDLTMGDDGKVYKNQDYLIKRQDDGEFAFQGEAGFLNSLFENTASFFGSDSDQTDTIPVIGAPSVQDTIDTQYGLLDDDQKEQLKNNISPQGVVDNARYEKLRRNDPEFLEAVKEEYGINAHFLRKDANVDQFGMVGDIPVTQLLMLNEQYVREMNLFRTELDDLMRKGVEQQQSGSNINTIMNKGGNNTIINSGSPSAKNENTPYFPIIGSI